MTATACHLSAREYIEAYEPRLLEVYLEPDAAIREEEQRAQARCLQLGLSYEENSNGEKAFPLIVWLSLN